MVRVFDGSQIVEDTDNLVLVVGVPLFFPPEEGRQEKAEGRVNTGSHQAEDN